MKQTITKEQWNEISDEDKLKLTSLKIFFNQELVFDGLLRVNFDDEDKLPNIGQMIEYLGDDLFCIDNIPQHKVYGVHLRSNDDIIEKEELLDALWETIKYKLKKVCKKK